MKTEQAKSGNSLFNRIYKLVQMIPRGRVATYGQIAKYIGRCSPKMVGYAMAAVHRDSDVPWQRIINFKGKISSRTGGDGEIIQRILLEDEGLTFDAKGCVDLTRFRWKGPYKNINT
jgi:methylated-DNA-protein-cysteine methyltransferase-like protein